MGLLNLGDYYGSLPLAHSGLPNSDTGSILLPVSLR
jgi:hypothetical protein